MLEMVFVLLKGKLFPYYRSRNDRDQLPFLVPHQKSFCAVFALAEEVTRKRGPQPRAACEHGGVLKGRIPAGRNKVNAQKLF